MTSPLAYVTPDTTVVEAMKVMSETHCRHLPVFAEGEVVGVISLGDLIRWLTAVSRNTSGIWRATSCAAEACRASKAMAGHDKGPGGLSMREPSRVTVAAVLCVVLTVAGCAPTSTVGSHMTRGLDFTAYRTYDWGPPDALPTGDPRLDWTGIRSSRITCRAA